MNVAVVGGGIGGLACAIAVRRAGADVTVFERRPEIAGRGTALGMWPEALAALDGIGLGERVRSVGVRQREMLFRRPDGRTLARLDVGRLDRRTGDLPVLISRAALIRLLLAEVPASSIRTNVTVTDIDELRAGFDVVVGADGAGSAVRAALFGPEHAPRYAGYSAWIGLAESADVGNPVSQEILGKGQKFGVTPAEAGQTNWYAPVWGRPDLSFAELRERFDGWCDPVGGLLARSTEVLHYPVRFLAPPLRTYVRGAAVLIGDAAHLMTADLGQGACQALVDGVTLGTLLGDLPVAAALARYDRSRRRLSQRVASTARRLGRFTLTPGLSPVRDGVFRAAGRIAS